MRAGLLAVRAGSAGKRFRPTRERRSRVDGRVRPSTRSLMVRPPAGSPYETSTNRQAGELGPRRDRGRPRAVGAFDLRRWGAGRAPLGERPARACARGDPTGARAARRFFPRPAARISTYAAAMKHDREGHASLTCGFARRTEREASAAPIRASQGGKNFNLCAHKLKFLPRSRGSPAADSGAARPRRKRRTEAGERPLAGAGAPRRLRRGLRLCDAAGRKAALRGRWAHLPIDP